MFKDSHPSEVKGGFPLTFHDPFETISKSSESFYTLVNQSVIYWVTPKLLTYDGSIESFDSLK